MALLGTCFKFPPIQAVTLYFYREYRSFAPSGQTFAYGRVPPSVASGLPSAADGSVTGQYSQVSCTDYAGNPVTFSLSFPEAVPSGEDTVFSAGSETEGWFYYDPGSTPNPDGNNCGTGLTYSTPFRLYDFIDDITANFPGGSFTGLTAGQAREYHFHDNDIFYDINGTSFYSTASDGGGSGNCQAVQLSGFSYTALDGDLFLYSSPYLADGSYAYQCCTGFDGCVAGSSNNWVPAKLAVPSVSPCTGLPFDVPGIAASFCAFTGWNTSAGGGPGYGIIHAVSKALAINDKYVLVTWVMMADGETFTNPSCVAFSSPGGGDVTIPCPDLKSLSTVAGSSFPTNVGMATLSTTPVGLLTKILVGYDCTTWAAAGSPF